MSWFDYFVVAFCLGLGVISYFKQRTEPKRTRTLAKFGLTFAIVLLFSHFAQAETVFLDTKPTGNVNPAEALKQIAGGKPAWKCQSVHSGPNLNPVNVKGSKPTWHTSETVGKGIDNVFDILASGKPTWRCDQMEKNDVNGRVRKAGWVLKHTKGPWYIGLPDGSLGRPKSIRSLTGSVCSFSAVLWDRNRDEALANARLIAVAPDLLEALKMAVAHIRHYAPIKLSSPDAAERAATLCDLQELIAKATGVSND